jgi:hypothetical protein
MEKSCAINIALMSVASVLQEIAHKEHEIPQHHAVDRGGGDGRLAG